MSDCGVLILKEYALRYSKAVFWLTYSPWGFETVEETLRHYAFPIVGCIGQW